MRNRSVIAGLMAVMMMTVSSCGGNEVQVSSSDAGVSKEIKVIAERGPKEVKDTPSTAKEDEAPETSEPDIAVWYPYWDYATADKELELIGDDLRTICFFAAYYDVNNEPFIPEDTVSAFKRLSESGKLEGRNTYLTFVNDKLLEEGSSLKDTELLYGLFGDEKSAKAHAEKVIKLTTQLGCSGIEIDYEAIKKDKKLWGLFNDFVSILADEAAARSMPLRVVFEPSAPIESYEWPDDTEYVMMCYNLKGYGTEPGPKADIAWINELSDRMKTLDGEINLAFATGGFDFGKDRTTAQVDYADAVKLLNEGGAEAQRDKKSGVLHFEYEDEYGTGHELWYADQETLKTWMDTARGCGINRISVWRLGGNVKN